MKFVPNKVTRSVATKVLTAKKHSPQLFFAAGVVGVIGGTVMACRATLKLHDTLDVIKQDVDTVKEKNEALDVTDQDYHRDTGIVYGVGVYHIAKLYGPAILVTGVSIAALTGSHVALTRRNAALTAAYAAIAKGFDEYRNRVRDELGAEREEHIYHAAETREIEDAEGKKIKAVIADPNKWSPYAKFFEESNANWQKNPELNRLFVQCQQTYANHLLQSRGHVFLNEVYDMLGFEHTQAGSVCGWVMCDPDEDGDNYIDFGIFEAFNADFVNGWERNIILDFNVDGVIYDKI